MAWMHAFDHDAPASSPQDQFKDILVRAAHGVIFGSHTAAHPQMLQDAGKNLVVAFKSCCRLKIRPLGGYYQQMPKGEKRRASEMELNFGGPHE